MSDLRVDVLPGCQPVEVAHGAGVVALTLLCDRSVGRTHQQVATAFPAAAARRLGELLIEQAEYAEQALR